MSVNPITRCDKRHPHRIWRWSLGLGLIGDVASEYRLSRPLVARLMGIFLAAVGLLVFAFAAAVGLFRLPVGILSAGVAVAVFGVFAGGFLLNRRAVVVGLDDLGYRVRFVRGAGVKRGRWKDVEDVVATIIAGERCVVLRLRDGRATTVPVGLLDVDADAFVRDLQQHLNRGHGYRPLS